MSGPYAEHAQTYLTHGWHPLPLPPGQKKPPPTGYTGTGPTPSGPDIYEWVQHYGHGNIALRLPPNIIGIDVDNYGGKGGAATLHRLTQRWGTLPPTWVSSSRDDQTSGIYLYRVPENLAWPGEAGTDIEIIQHHHRYMVAPPSVHPEGRKYRWRDPHGLHTTLIPDPHTLPDLPEQWITGLTGGLLRTPTTPHPAPHNTLTAQWLTQAPPGPPCGHVVGILTQTLTALPTEPRHAVGRTGTLRLVTAGQHGHRGTTLAIATLRDAWYAAALDPTRVARPEHVAHHEWASMLNGAVALNATTTPTTEDPCDETRALQDLFPTTTTPPVGAHTVGTEEPTAPRPTWEPVDLTPILNGTHDPEKPTIMPRTDGQALLYPGRLHSFHGESESGKSLLAQIETANQITNDNPVLYVDYESDPQSVTARLLALGATPHNITEHFTYIRPEQSPYQLVEQPAWNDLLTHRYTLAIIDGVTDALTTYGGATKENDDITRWVRTVPGLIARRTGAATVLIDHVTKNTETRGRYAIGGQAKMNALDGAAYLIEIATPIGKGLTGTLTMRIGKDRPSGIRPRCGQWRAQDRTQEAATITIDSTRPGRTIATINPPAHLLTPDGDPEGPTGPERPTYAMERVSHLLSVANEMSRNQIVDTLQGDGLKLRKQTILEAIQILVEEKYLQTRRGPRRGQPVTHLRTYQQRDDPLSAEYAGPDDWSDIL